MVGGDAGCNHLKELKLGDRNIGMCYSNNVNAPARIEMIGVFEKLEVFYTRSMCISYMYTCCTFLEYALRLTNFPVLRTFVDKIAEEKAFPPDEHISVFARAIEGSQKDRELLNSLPEEKEDVLI